MAKTVVIVRGPSGSGKSTYVKEEFGTMKNSQHRTIVSGDDFFMVETSYPDPRHTGPGPAPRKKEYRFDPTKLGEAHANCLRSFLTALASKTETIVVDNTNIHEWEYMNYVLAAKMNGYAVDIVDFRPVTIDDIRTCIARNVHRVPAEVVSRMCVEFEPCPFATVMDIGIGR